MKLTTTLQKLRDAGACESGYKKLAKHVGGCKKYGMDTEINLLTILESNGVQDMLWSLRATDQDSKRTASKLAIDFAMEALPIFEAKYPDDKRPRHAIQAARDYLNCSILLETLRDARRAAAADAAYAAYAAADDADAAYAAYDAAAADAAYAAAADAAYAAYAAADDAAYAAYDAAAAAAAAAAADAADDAAGAAADAAYAAYAAYAADAKSKAVERQKEIIRMVLE